MKASHCIAAIFIILLSACSASPPAEQHDRQAVLAQMQAMWARPDAPLDAGPVVVAGDHAIADWTQGERGGRALLMRHHGEWRTVLCAGDGIRSAEGLVAVGVPAAIAERLATGLAEAEKQVPAERLARMSAFAGVLRMENGGAHGQHH